MGSKKLSGWTIIFIILTLIIGFVAGNYFSSKTVGRKLFLSSGNKINVILDIIDEEYVDSVDMNQLVEEAIPKLISELDPHSTYIPAEKLKAVNEDLEGHFGGIGVGFMVQDDTVMIASIVKGGPAEQSGLQPSDRIVTIGDSLFVGQNINNEKTIETLRGLTGSKVKLGIRRNGADKLLTYEITRGEIPVNTVSVAYKAAENTGLIKINKFGRTTYSEFVQAVAKLSKDGCNSFIIDLRSNLGGLMEAAVNIANDFLPDDRLIVYTKGNASAQSKFYANGTGTCQDKNVIVLMDEISASASEIVAGAIQDNDRGLIIGRRSYGKGLVQNQIDLSDGSALRLTIARYYTPSGRCIQRNYELGKSDNYEQDWINRFSHGESYSQDSIKQNMDLKYQTLAGRPVYGGGGIMPDIFIPRDTSGFTSYFMHLQNEEIIAKYAFYYVDKYRKILSKFKDSESIYNYLKPQPLLENIVEFAEQKGIHRRSNLVTISGKLIQDLTISYIIQYAMGEDFSYPILLKDDPVVTRAIEAIRNGEASPENISGKGKLSENNLMNHIHSGFQIQLPDQLIAAHRQFVSQHRG